METKQEKQSVIDPLRCRDWELYDRTLQVHVDAWDLSPDGRLLRMEIISLYPDKCHPETEIEVIIDTATLQCTSNNISYEIY